MIERKHFTGGMDIENVPDFIAANDYIVAENCRMFRDEDGGGLAFKPVNSTNLRLNHENVLPKSCIGSITDEAKGRVYFFMYHGGTGQDHTIWAWDRKENVGYRVLRSVHVDGGLLFDRSFPITGLALIGDDLYWTDNKSNPRRVNVERGIKTNHPAYISQNGTIPEPYELQIKQSDISVIRRPPAYPLTITQLNEGRTVNFTKDGVFQFAARYKFRDGQYSVLSIYSKTVSQNKDGDNNDTIQINLPKKERIDNEVQAIEFLVRRGESAPFYIIKTFDRQVDGALFSSHNNPGLPNTVVSHKFYNDSVGVGVADAEAYVAFHDVPLLSKSLEIAGNRLFLGNNLKGYDWNWGSISLAVVPDSLTVNGTFWALGWQCGGIVGSTVVLRIDTGSAAGYYTTDLTPSSPIPASYTLDPTRYLGSLTDFTLIQLVYYFSPCGSGIDLPPGPSIVNMGASSIIVNGLAFQNGTNVFKSGSAYKVGVCFYDNYDRTSGVVHSPSEITIPEREFSTTVFNGGIQWTLPSGPQPNYIPSWATRYSIVRTKNLTQLNFIAERAGNCRYVNKNADGEYVGTATTYNQQDAILIPLVLFLSNGVGYTYTEGDICKLIVGNEIYRLNILAVQGVDLIVSPINLGDISTDIFYIEIYRPNVLPENELYYEVGEIYDIGNSGTINRSFSQTSGVLSGDVGLVRRGDPSLVSNFWISEVMNVQDRFWSMWPQDVGRSRVEIFSKQRRYETEIAWGGVFFPGTESNDINGFLSGDIKTLDNQMGSLNKLVFTARAQDYGTVMLAIGDNEIASLYLGRSEFYNTQEGSSVLTSADVIGTVNILRGGYGCINPESVVENDGDVYWFSAVKAAAVRYNRNGLVPISDYKFAPFFKWLANKVMLAQPTVDNYLIVGGFDEYNKEYLITTPTETVRRFPITYDVLSEMDETVKTNDLGGNFYNANLEAGELYKISVETNSGQSVTIAVTDLYFGSATYSESVGTIKSVQFFAASSGLVSFRVMSGGVIKGVQVYKQRLNPYVVVNSVPKTFAFSEVENRWKAVYRFVPDWFGRIADVLVSFKNALLYTHDNTNVPSTFYGVQYSSGFAFVANQPPNVVKRYQGISLETDEAPSYVHIRTEFPNLQSSDLIESEFSDLEGVPYASFRKDGLSPNVSGTRLNKQARGDDMIGRWAKIFVEFAKNRTFVTRMVNIISRPSSGHKL